MTSYRENLKKIGIQENEFVSYRGFYSRPQSLRQAILSMEAPQESDWQLDELNLDTDWTNVCNGVAFDGRHWFFSSNEDPKKVYALAVDPLFKEGSFEDADILDVFVFHDSHLETPEWGSDHGGGINHIGQITFHEGLLYVSQFNDYGHVIVLDFSKGHFEWVRCIRVGRQPLPGGGDLRVEFQAINPWDNHLYTSFPEGVIDTFFMHDGDGKYLKENLFLKPPIVQSRMEVSSSVTKVAPFLDTIVDLARDEAGIDINDVYPGFPIQGACFSPNGHLYIASNSKEGGNNEYQYIWYYSPLNGYRFGGIRVKTAAMQELEGICYAEGCIMAVLLHKVPPSKDNIFLKRYRAANPAIV